MPDKQGRMTACVDFDGVLNNYKGWKGVGVFEEPVDGAAEGMQALKALGWFLIIHTTRIERDLMSQWLHVHNIPYDRINEMPEGAQDNPPNPGKPPADVYIDDRAFRFDGSWPTLLAHLSIQDNITPWGKKVKNIKHIDEGAMTNLVMAPQLPRIDQIAFLVRDTEQPKQLLAALGMFPKAEDIIENTNPRMYGPGGFGGRLVQHRLKLVFYDWHGMELEFLQVLEGETRHNGMLQEGQFACLSHLGAHVESIDDWVKLLPKYPVIQTDNVRDRWKYAYLFTSPYFGFDLKLIQRLYNYEPALETNILNLAHEAREKMVHKKSADYMDAWKYCGLLGAMAHIQKKFFLLWNWIWFGRKALSEDAQSVRRELMDLFVYSGIALTCYDQKNQNGSQKWH